MCWEVPTGTMGKVAKPRTLWHVGVSASYGLWGSYGPHVSFVRMLKQTI